MEKMRPETKPRTPSSRILQDVLDKAPENHFTIGWLISALRERSFGIVILLLGLLATADRLYGARPYADGRGGPDDCGPERTRFPRIPYCPKLADTLSIP